METSPLLAGLAPGITWNVLAEFLARSESCLFGRLDARGVVLAANPCLTHRLAPFIDATLAAALTPPSAESWRALLAELDRGGPPQIFDLEFGRNLASELTFRCLAQRDEEGTVWIFGEPEAKWLVAQPRPPEEIVRQLADLVRARADAESLALTDPLTGLANRRQADLWLQVGPCPASRSHGLLACVMVDLDLLKEVNDTYGHPAGDRMVQAAARALAEGVRARDQVARYGGDEFVILLPNTDLPGAVALAQRLRSHLARIIIPPLERGLTASFGASVLQPGERCDAVRDRADAALLVAKRRGGNRIATA